MGKQVYGCSLGTMNFFQSVYGDPAGTKVEGILTNEDDRRDLNGACFLLILKGRHCHAALDLLCKIGEDY